MALSGAPQVEPVWPIWCVPGARPPSPAVEDDAAPQEAPGVMPLGEAEDNNNNENEEEDIEEESSDEEKDQSSFDPLGPGVTSPQRASTYPHLNAAPKRARILSHGGRRILKRVALRSFYHHLHPLLRTDR